MGLGQAQAQGGADELCERLAAKRGEIERAVLTRAHAIADPTDTGDPRYVSGLTSAVSAAVGYGIAAMAASGRVQQPIPPALLEQARQAARNEIGLETVLRRYFAGYALVGDFVMREAQAVGIPSGDPGLRRLMQTEASTFDRLVTAVAAEHAGELRRGQRHGSQRRRTEQVRGLLAGELVDVSELAYELDSWHLGLMASGPGATPAVRELAVAAGCALLVTRPDERTIWAWLGGREAIPVEEAKALAERCLPPEVSLALGGPARGLEGWRLSHRQAAAAMSVIECGGEQVLCYADASLLASALRDEVLAQSLRELYLAPLAQGPDGGVVLRETLRAYLTAGRNVSCAAAALGISRRTVSNRLRTIEDRLGRPVDSCAAELETALRLQHLDEAHCVGRGQNAQPGKSEAHIGGAVLTAT